jgi:hypothetical protein
MDAAWCHLTGWWDKQNVKATHLVPKCLEASEVSHLFGVRAVKDDFFLDWRVGGWFLGLLCSNRHRTDSFTGITLHSKIEEGLDQGWIGIILVPGHEPITRWKCILINEEKRSLPALRRGEDIHGHAIFTRWGVSFAAGIRDPDASILARCLTWS